MNTSATEGKPIFRLLVIPAVVLVAACNSGTELPLPSESWTKLDALGQPLTDPGRGEHHCVYDERTGLTWEVARNGSDLHAPGQTYSWYSDDGQRAMSDPGHRDGGDCVNSPCDTQGRVEAVNTAGLCGHFDWAMPTRTEMMTLGDRSLMEATGLIVDTAFFPEMEAGEYWSAETFRLYPQSAWAVDMRHGLDRADHKMESKSVILVRRDAELAGDRAR